MRSSSTRHIALSGIAALVLAGMCAVAVVAPAGADDAASRLGGLALPGSAAQQTEAADADAGSDAASRLGGLAAPSSSTSSLGGLAAPSSSTSGSGLGGLAAPAKSGSSLGGLAAPGAAAGDAASDVWSPADGDWTYDLDCAACHEKESSSFENEKCLAAKHAALDCKLCHSDEEGLVKAHGAITAKTASPTALVSTKIDTEATCQLCHDPEKLVEATAESTVLTDDNGTVVNPHDMPVNDAHEADGTTCISCHKVHSTTALEKTAQRYCKGCHHAGVYECNTCHAA